nr:SIMPL domain-containing protein [Candidatus Levybacteria bacterium]
MNSFFQQFKTPIVTIAFLFLTFFIYTKLAGPIPFFVNSVTTTKTDLFTAEGQGQVTAVPDSATLYAGITQTALNVADAKDKTNSLVNKVISALKALGIAEKDIKTTNYSVTPNYNNNKEIVPMMYPIRDSGNNITGYTVTQNLEVKVKDTSKINKAIDTVTISGANLVGGVNFTFSDEMLEKLENQARKEAVTKAKKKAQSLASASGIHLGKIINVVENSSFPRIMPMAAGEAVLKDTQVTPGENTVTINVTIYYETY